MSGKNSDWQQFQLLIVRLCKDGGAEAGQQEQTGRGERHGPWLTHLLTNTLNKSFTKSLTHSLSTENKGAGAANYTLQIHNSDTSFN